MQDYLNRRDFIKLSIAAGISSVPFLTGCAAFTFEDQAPVLYPPLKGHKVQPPEHGCFFGMYPNIRSPKDWYIDMLGIEPKILTLRLSALGHYVDFPKTIVKEIAVKSSIPFVYKDLTSFINVYGFNNLVNNNDFEDNLIKYAQNVVSAKEPLFISTMREMNSRNTHVRPWKGKRPTDVKALWRYMWQVFEDNGANEYATWVWEVLCPEGRGNYPREPEAFFPGSKYVDWIGLSAFSSSSNYHGSLASIARQTYKQMRINHPEIPVMMAEFANKPDKRQPTKLALDFKTLKDWPGIKAFIYWDNVGGYSKYDHSLTRESYDALRKILKDPYFICAE